MSSIEAFQQVPGHSARQSIMTTTLQHYSNYSCSGQVFPGVKCPCHTDAEGACRHVAIIQTNRLIGRPQPGTTQWTLGRASRVHDAKTGRSTSLFLSADAQGFERNASLLSSPPEFYILTNANSGVWSFRYFLSVCMPPGATHGPVRTANKLHQQVVGDTSHAYTCHTHEKRKHRLSLPEQGTCEQEGNQLKQAQA